MSLQTDKRLVWLGLLALYIAWGSTYLAIRVAIETIPPFLMAGVRFLIPGLILYGWQRLRGEPAPTRVEWRSAAIVGLLLLVGGNGLVIWAEQWVPSGITALLVGSVPLMMALIDAMRPRGVKPGWMASIGLLVGFGGIILLVRPTQSGSDPLQLDTTGVLILLLASFLWAAGSLYNRNARLPKSPLMGTGMEMLVGCAALFLLGTCTGEWGHLDLAAISTRSALGLVYLIIFGSLVGFTAYTWLLRVAPTPLVGTYAYVNPLIAILLGSLLVQELVTGRVLLSAGIIIGAVALINFERYGKPKETVARSALSGND